jgi:hypothetical protein
VALPRLMKTAMRSPADGLTAPSPPPHTHTHGHTHTHTGTRTGTHIHTRTHTLAHARIPFTTHALVCTYPYQYARTKTTTHTHVHMHTRTHAGARDGSVWAGLTATCATQGATVRFTLDGSRPSETSPEWPPHTAPPRGRTAVLVRAFKQGLAPSSTDGLVLNDVL